MLIIAHRGLHKTCHENSIEAFNEAIKAKVDMIEFDVRKLKCGTMVLNHDKDIDGIYLNKTTFSELELLNLPHKTPLFEEVLKIFADKVKLDIELKEEGYEKEAIDLILKYLKPSEVFITSFKPKILLKVRKILPEARIGLLLSTHKIFNLLWLPFFNLFIPQYIVFKNLKYLFLIFRKEYIIWDVKSKKQVSILSKIKSVTGVITDNSDELSLRS